VSDQHGDRHSADGGTTGEKKHVWDNPENVRRLLRVIYAISAGLVIADLIVHRHLVHPWEGLPGFYALYGLLACVSLVLVAKRMRNVLMRDEDYYDAV